MTDISEPGCRLSVEHRQLVIQRDGSEARTIPMADIAVLVVSATWTTYTQSVLALLAECGGVLVVCDGRCLPLSMCLPIFGHSRQAQRLRQQFEMPAPARKQTWKRLVVAKVRNQGLLLRKLRGDDGGLIELAATVRSGDPVNVEAQAARIYWPRVFGDATFRREPQADTSPNHFLDYGYAVLRAFFARAICGSALNPTLGVFHRNRDNSFCLADDLMEPFRPLVDARVAEILSAGRGGEVLTREMKSWLLAGLLGRVPFNGEARTVPDCAARISASFAALLEGAAEELLLPGDFTYET